VETDVRLRTLFGEAYHMTSNAQHNFSVVHIGLLYTTSDDTWLHQA
jgi:hypothetical protein